MRLILIAAIFSLLTACSNDEASSGRTRLPAPAAAQVTELQRIDLLVAPGEGISQGQRAVVHYTGWLYEPSAPESKGRKFDSSRDRGVPFRFTIGNGDVIKGWDEGVQGMRIGTQRRLIVPASLGYGERGAGNGTIPPNAALVFDIELLAIEDA